MDDIRGTMFYYYAEFLRQLQPKMFLAENVKGLTTHDNGKTLRTMLNVFGELGYEVEWKVLDAWNYGVAEKRQRVVIIGIRRDLKDKIKFEYPDVARDYMKSCYFMGGGRTGIARRLSWNEPSLTLTCSPMMKQTDRCHPDESRPFTTREYARIQSFPDNWSFVGKMSDVYKQIGNAVPVELARNVGESIMKALGGNENVYIYKKFLT